MTVEVSYPAPPADPRWALFLDLDGTLIDFAATPDAVIVPDGLVALLARLAGLLDGALAIVSGRPIGDIDRFMAPLILPCGAEHGAVIRLGTDDSDAGLLPPVPAAWLVRAASAIDALPGTLLERKSHGLVLHYRQSPISGEVLKRLAETLVAESAGAFELLASNMAWEIRPKGVSKGGVVEHFMTRPPFAARIPVFIGDDVTDRDGCAAAMRLGGLGLMVPEVFPGGPAEVRAWLAAVAQSISD